MTRFIPMVFLVYKKTFHFNYSHVSFDTEEDALDWLYANKLENARYHILKVDNPNHKVNFIEGKEAVQ